MTPIKKYFSRLGKKKSAAKSAAAKLNGAKGGRPAKIKALPLVIRQHSIPLKIKL